MKLYQKKIIKDTGQCITSCEDSNQYKYEYDNKCYNNCPTGTKDDGNNRCICFHVKCLECQGQAYTRNLCTKCNVDYYPKENDPRNSGNIMDCYKNSKGFYLDAIYSVYRACYYTAKLV